MKERIIHVLDYVCQSRDPDGRAEAISMCGEFEECSSTGKHGFVSNPHLASCQLCKKLSAASDDGSL